MHIYLPLRPHATGHPQGGGYQCGACGLAGLAYGEPHYRHGDGSSSQVCEDAVPANATPNHPQYAFSGKGIRARASIGLGYGHVLERRDDDGVWRPADLGPPQTFAQPTAEVEQNEPDAIEPETVDPENVQPTRAVTDGAIGEPGRIPTRDEYVAAGYSPETYEQRFGRNPAKIPLAPITAPPIELEPPAVPNSTERPIGTETQTPPERAVDPDQPAVPGAATNDVPPTGVPTTFVPPAQMTQGGGDLSTKTPEGEGGEHTT